MIWLNIGLSWKTTKYVPPKFWFHTQDRYSILQIKGFVLTEEYFGLLSSSANQTWGLITRLQELVWKLAAVKNDRVAKSVSPSLCSETIRGEFMSTVGLEEWTEERSQSEVNLLSSGTLVGWGHWMDSYSVRPKLAEKIATRELGLHCRVTVSFSQTTLDRNSSGTRKFLLLNWRN